MKKNPAVFIAGGFLLLLSSCGFEGFFSPPTEDTATEATAAPKADTAPHEVGISTGATFAFIPDSAYNTLVIGSAASFEDFVKHNGANAFQTGPNRWTCYYLTHGRHEKVIIRLLHDKAGRNVPYAIDITKYHEEKFPPGVRNEDMMNNHVITMHGIYIGMSQQYVMTVYTDQKFIQQSVGDSICLTYRPKEKDKEYYHPYSWKDVTARYKFVGDYLRRIEYSIDPAALEKVL